MTLYRGIKAWSGLELNPNQTIGDLAFSSKSLSEVMASGFISPENKCCLIEITYDQPSKQLPLYLNSEFPTELEILSYPGELLYILARTQDNIVKTIYQDNLYQNGLQYKVEPKLDQFAQAGLVKITEDTAKIRSNDVIYLLTGANLTPVLFCHFIYPSQGYNIIEGEILIRAETYLLIGEYDKLYRLDMTNLNILISRMAYSLDHQYKLVIDYVANIDGIIHTDKVTIVENARNLVGIYPGFDQFLSLLLQGKIVSMVSTLYQDDKEYGKVDLGIKRELVAELNLT